MTVEAPAELVEFVLEETGQPIDVWAVAATLESGGVRDADARARGARDVFELAEAVLAECRTRPLPASEPSAVSRIELRRFVRLYLRGGFFFIPFLMQLVALVALGYGLWASVDFSLRQASIVGCALIFSFVVTGPVVQVLGYVGPRFAEAGKHTLAARAANLVLGVGVLALALGAAVWTLAAWAAHAWAWRTLGAGVVYYALAGLLGLAGGLLYMLRQFAAIVVVTALGIAVVGVVLHETSLGIYAAHWLGLGVAVAAALAWGDAVLRRRSQRAPAELAAAVAPPLPLLARAALPFAVYGLAYYGLLFADRLFAWSAGSHGRPFTFRADYEVGLDWALLAVTPALAYLEIAVHALSDRLAGEGAWHPLERLEQHNRGYRRFYLRRLLAIALLWLAGSGLCFAVFHAAHRWHALHGVGRFFADPTTIRVYVVVACGYGLLVWGVYNGSFLFALGRPWQVLRALLPAFAVAVATALACSRLIEPWAASFGLAAGALVFAGLSLLEVRRVLDRIDYFAFAAF